MEEREKKRKILFIVLGVIAIILLFFMIKSCSSNKTPKPKEDAITSIELALDTLTLTVGDQETLSYNVLPKETSEVTRWLSSNERVATVDESGNIKALDTGSTVITLVGEGSVSDYVIVKVVSKQVEDGTYVTARLVENDVLVKVGSTKKLEYELDPIDAKYIDVTFESNNNLVATVSSDGVVTGVKSGVTTVNVKIVLADNTVVTDTATVTVEDNASLYMTTTVPDVRIGEVIRLNAALSTNDVVMTEANVKSSNEKVAVVSNVTSDSGYLTFDVKGLKAGNVTLKLTAITSDGKTLNLDVPVVVVKFTDLFISSGDKTISVGDSFVLSGRLEPSIEGALDVECKSSNEKVASVTSTSPSGEYNGACQINGIKEGSSTITITISGQKQTIKVTVENKVVPEDPSETPGGNENPNETPGENENPSVIPGEPKITVTLDKDTYNLNDTAKITVTFVDENGESKVLTDSDYILATDFDSTSLGEKKLVVIYPYGELSLKGEANYTISGGPTSSMPAGSIAGSSGSSGSSSSSSSRGGVKKTTVKYTVDCEKDDDGNCKESLKAKVKVQNAKKDTTNVVVFFECNEEDGDCSEKLDIDYYKDGAVGDWNLTNMCIPDEDGSCEGYTSEDGKKIVAVTVSVPNDKLTDEMKDPGLIDPSKVDETMGVLSEEGTQLGSTDKIVPFEETIVGSKYDEVIGGNSAPDNAGNKVWFTKVEEGVDYYTVTLNIEESNNYKAVAVTGDFASLENLTKTFPWNQSIGASVLFEKINDDIAGEKNIIISASYSVEEDDKNYVLLYFKDKKEYASDLGELVLHINMMNGYVVDNIVFGENFPDAFKIKSGSQIIKTTRNVVNVTVKLKNTQTGELDIHSASAQAEFINEPSNPTCTAFYDKNNGTVKVVGTTSVDDHDIVWSISSNDGLTKHEDERGDTRFTSTFAVSNRESGKYSFTVKAHSGKTGTCSTVVGDYCLLPISCGIAADDSLSNDSCEQCAAAGCSEADAKVSGFYECVSEKDPKQKKYGYKHFDILRFDSVSELTSGEDKISIFDEDSTWTMNVSLNSNLDEYTCKYIKTKDKVCIKESNIESDKNGTIDTTTYDFNRNCAICGCKADKWILGFRKTYDGEIAQKSSKMLQFFIYYPKDKDGTCTYSYDSKNSSNYFVTGGLFPTIEENNIQIGKDIMIGDYKFTNKMINDTK